MTRNDSGRLEISPAILGTIITACLAVGSGGAFAVSRGNTSAEASAVMRSDSRIAVLEERSNAQGKRYDEIALALKELSGKMTEMNSKIDRHMSWERAKSR